MGISTVTQRTYNNLRQSLWTKKNTSRDSLLPSIREKILYPIFLLHPCTKLFLFKKMNYFSYQTRAENERGAVPHLACQSLPSYIFFMVLDKLVLDIYIYCSYFKYSLILPGFSVHWSYHLFTVPHLLSHPLPSVSSLNYNNYNHPLHTIDSLVFLTVLKKINFTG